MNVWIPDRVVARDAIGPLPGAVTLNVIPREGELPRALLQAEFLVPGAADARLEAMFAQMPSLRVIQTLSAGVDRLLEKVPAGVVLCDARGSRDAAVAEWVLAVILASLKLLPEMRDAQRAHAWAQEQPGELAGRTAMILGYGSIGAAVEARLEAFGVELIRVARRPRPGVHAVSELHSLLPRADIVIVLLPLTPATEGLLDAGLLAQLRPGALLVNGARGAIVDPSALLELLQPGRIRAALDVTEPEPLAPADPLWDAPGTLITPHFAGDTAAAERRAFALVGEQVRRYVRGEPLLNVVEGGY